MANLNASKKNIRKIKRQTARNRSVISNLRTVTKTVTVKKDQASLTLAYKKIDSALSKGKIHKNKANRLKSRLAILVTSKPKAAAPAATKAKAAVVKNETKTA
jgi:small subunit ribosomal protein S20